MAGRALAECRHASAPAGHLELSGAQSGCPTWVGRRRSREGMFSHGRLSMLKRLRLLVLGLLVALALPVAAQAKTLYWISHGGPADPVWTYFLQGAEAWAKATGQT